MEKNIYTANEEQNNMRLDKYLSSIITDKSRSFIQGLIEKENVIVNGKKVKSNHKVKIGRASCRERV